MPVSDRIRDICELKGYKQSHLVNLKLGSKQTISFIWNGKQDPNYEFLSGFTHHFPDVNARWLLTGEGEKILEMVTKPYDIELLIQTFKEDHKQLLDKNEQCGRLLQQISDKDKEIFRLKERISRLEQRHPKARAG